MTQEVYDAIITYWRTYSVPPTTRWLAKTLHRSESVIFYHQRKLGQMGLLVRVGYKWVPAEIKKYLALFQSQNTQKGVLSHDKRN